MLVFALLAVLLEDFALEEERLPLLVLVDLLLVLDEELDEFDRPPPLASVPGTCIKPDGSTKFTGSFMQYA